MLIKTGLIFGVVSVACARMGGVGMCGLHLDRALCVGLGPIRTVLYAGTVLSAGQIRRVCVVTPREGNPGG